MQKRSDKNLKVHPQHFEKMFSEGFLNDPENDKKFTLEQMLMEANRWIPSFATKQERYKVTDEVNERTVRFYIGRGLIDRPIRREGRKSIFSYKHVLQLLTVKFLQSNYIPLKKIAHVMAVSKPNDLLSLLVGKRPVPLAVPGLVRNPGSPVASGFGNGRRKRFQIHEKIALDVDEEFDILGEDVDVKKIFNRIMQVLADTAKGRPSAQDQMIQDACFDDLDWDHVSPARSLRDRTKAVVALVTEGGLVPQGNPDKLEPARASRFLRYSIENIEDLKSGEFESIDRGWDRKHVNDDPDRLLPLDVMRDLEKEHEFSRLHPYYYTTTGAGTPADVARNIGKELAAELKAQGVSAVLLTST
jgi:DNA-binding transcriptional MerR regulator